MEALGITPTGLIAYIINFALLVILLQIFLYKPVKNMLAERQQHIADNLAAADRAAQEAAQQRSEFEKELAQARQASQVEARKAAETTEKMRQEILEAARKEAETIKAQAYKEAEQEKEQIAADLQEQAADLALQMTRKIIGEGIDEPTQRKLVSQFLVDLGET
ncbi:MAG: F0F1 ATP synthase subunit B [Anaerolineae bacterium]|nr:F0F1 ATP synthase subunit B [Anaerolineae bacterium]